MNAAPFFAEVADGPADGCAHWVQASDGRRIRLGLWNKDAAQGTVLLLPGRTEYIEKYGRAASDLATRGYATLAIDWRGQGLADRALDDRMSGHVADFAEYQLDLDAMIAFAQAQSLPQPFYLIAHSMGGCIGLRGLMRGIPVQAAAFSAPMWGILMASWMRPMASVIATASRMFNLDARYAPGTGAKTYVLEAAFSGNSLTSEPEMWEYMRAQAQAHPELTLGGPSLGWVRAALSECHALGLMHAPSSPAVCALGTAEKIVDLAPIHSRMAGWATGQLDLYQGSEHEVMMERPAIRARFFDQAAALFSTHR